MLCTLFFWFATNTFQVDNKTRVLPDKRGNKSYIHFRRDNNLRGGINGPEWKKNQFMKEKTRAYKMMQRLKKIKLDHISRRDEAFLKEKVLSRSN